MPPPVVAPQGRKTVQPVESSGQTTVLLMGLAAAEEAALLQPVGARAELVEETGAAAEEAEPVSIALVIAAPAEPEQTVYFSSSSFASNL